MVSTRSPGNIGSSARVLKNFGFKNLHLVNPHLHKRKDEEEGETYFEKETRRMAYKSYDILEKAKIFNKFEDAISEFSLVLGTDPNPPHFSNVLSVEDAAKIVAEKSCKTAVVFGSESDGLSKKEISYCSYIIKIPTVDNFPDLNLSHSLAIVAYLISREMNKSDFKYVKEKPSLNLINKLTSDFLEIGVKSGFVLDKNCNIANELRNIFITGDFSLRGAGILRSLARRIKSKIDKKL